MNKEKQTNKSPLATHKHTQAIGFKVKKTIASEGVCVWVQ